MGILEQSQTSYYKNSSNYGNYQFTSLEDIINQFIVVYVGEEKLIPKACKYLLLGKKIPLHNNGTPIRNWLHAQDTADAIISIIKNMDEHIVNNIFNIAGGYEQSNMDTVSKIITLYYPNEKKLQPNTSFYYKEFVNYYLDFSFSRQGQDVRYALNDDKLRSLGWKPKKQFDQELPDIIKYYKEKFIL